ncbi:hypothetical protein COT82_00970 [Candidatus Campbellbacteria bacterium CG10_big_fil_rev_8_21_14_0_10_35_52]|uniref:SHS2 domain-containing protein n=1 Tax=Candidatus Campbellbacteria bacterium CG10_big_fil_rev_8_21_14_0_10_35_52 TaxID=1974527 RepID=A0A2M6WVX4_9BACT|nr:MAG: hypothetical protein COT82_00970 [Candidatus Campbellbacteria bacterium CG10_big_fil_rev_8_21_14_0_10_35_52]
MSRDIIYTMKLLERKGIFTKFFPTPNFLAERATGVDISDSSVRFVELADTKYGEIPFKFGEHLLQEGIIVNGDIQNVDALAEELKKIKEKNNLNFIRASLPEEKVYLFRTHIPEDIEKKQIRSILEFKLEEYVPISPKEAVFDYEIINNQKENLQGHTDVSVAVYTKNTVEKYFAAFDKAGLTPLSFEVETQAITRSVVRYNDDGIYMIIDFGKTRAGLAIIDKCVLSFTSTFKIDGRILARVIKESHDISEDNINQIKNEYGLIKNKNNKELFSAFMNIAEQLKDNIDKHYKYWKTRVDETGKRVSPIEKIILCGGNSNLAGLPEYLSGSLKVPVERANVWVNAFSLDDFVPNMDRFQSLSYATAIGLVLRDVN